MGVALSIFYFVVSYLTPDALFGPLAQFHVELILALLTVLVSLPRIPRSAIFKATQPLALLGLALAVLFSVFAATHWLKGSLSATLAFIPILYAYFLVFLFFDSVKKLRYLIAALVLVCIYIIGRGTVDLVTGLPVNGPPIAFNTGSVDQALWDSDHPYLFPMENNTGDWFYRIRGLGMINDPNDFAQLLVTVIPLLFVFWQPRSMLKNMLLVIVPALILILGVFLTHSRGSLLALSAMAIVIGRRRIGTVPAVLLGVCLFVGAMALHFTGGRDISASSGEDRISLWGQGMAALKTHPLFGVGYGSLGEYTDTGQTAHNSIVVCASETGFFGLFFWSLFLFPTIRDSLTLASPEKTSDSESVEIEKSPSLFVKPQIEVLDKDEINRLGRSVFFALTGFLVTGWFLSRAFVLTLFLLGGMAEVTYQMAIQRGMVAPRLRFSKTIRSSGLLAISLLVVMYIAVRTLNLMH